MPYIKPNDRIRVRDMCPQTAGELNYCISQLYLQYMQTKGLNYLTINDILGATEGAKLEFYRRIAVPYEEIKIKENGDIYE